MFKQTSVKLREYLASKTEFTTVMLRSYAGADKLMLFPFFANSGNTLPLATYTFGEKNPFTKDINQLGVIELNLWFESENYDACCEFTDSLDEVIAADHEWISSVIEYNAESDTYSGIIRFKLI